jgi:hypothetical protein
MPRLRVREVCPESRLFRPDGARLRAAIESAWSEAAPLEVDFEGEAIASISFLDEGIATLFVDHDAELIRRRLQIVGLTDPDRRELNKLVAKRRAERRAA